MTVASRPFSERRRSLANFFATSMFALASAYDRHYGTWRRDHWTEILIVILVLDFMLFAHHPLVTRLNGALRRVRASRRSMPSRSILTFIYRPLGVEVRGLADRFVVVDKMIGCVFWTAASGEEIATFCLASLVPLLLLHFRF